MTLEWILSIVGTMLGSSTISVFATSWFARKKTSAEANNVTIEGTIKWAESMRKDIDELRNDLKETRNDYKELQKENNSLRLEIAQLRGELLAYKVKHGDLPAVHGVVYNT